MGLILTHMRRLGSGMFSKTTWKSCCLSDCWVKIITNVFLVQNNYYNLYTTNRVGLPFGILLDNICTNQISLQTDTARNTQGTMSNTTHTYWSLVLLKKANDDIEVSLEFVTVLWKGERRYFTVQCVHSKSFSSTSTFIQWKAQCPCRAWKWYSQISEIDVILQTVVVDLKQSALIGYVSGNTRSVLRL